MTAFLIQLAIGPVQGFISTARRTRDLWFGSWLLSEVSKSVARHLASGGGRLVFPNPAHLQDLAPGSPLLVANIVLAQIECVDMVAARASLAACRAAAQTRWEELCTEAERDIGATCRRFKLDTTEFLRRAVWDAQRGDIIEVFGAAVPLAGDSPAEYVTASERLRDLLAQRKNTRDFVPYADDTQLPKSSLDGNRSTVLQASADPAHQARQQRVRAALGIEPSEQLDLPGIVKRVLGRERAFVPVARIAADPWIEKALGAEAVLLKAVSEATEKLVPYDLASGLRVEGHRAYPWLGEFPYDAQLLYSARIEAAATKVRKGSLGLDVQESARAGTSLDALGGKLKTLGKAVGAPCPYYALLLADGDRMGELIDAAARLGADAHREISRRLSDFAQSVPALVTQHRGVCVYSGGDDVLAMVRIDRALECAEALAADFAARMGEAVAAVFPAGGAPAQAPTLSVGIVIAHMLEPLGDVRELAARAERLAKRGPPGTAAGVERNALGLLIQPRSGSAYSLRLRWDDATGLARMRDVIEAFRDKDVPAGLPYELRELLAREEALLGASAARVWPALAARVLERKLYGANGQPGAGKWRRRLHDAVTKNLGSDSATARIEQLLCARWLAGRTDEARG
jgi:CRISPR-associated protein Cmr2